MLYRLISNKPRSNAEYKKRNKKFKRIILVLIILFTIILWIFNSYKLQTKTNELYENGVESKGSIISIEEDNLNSGSITSWDVYYNYHVGNFKYSGKLVSYDKPNLIVGDSILICYSPLRPDFHNSYLYEINHEYIRFDQAMLEEWYFVAIGFIFVVLTVFSKNELDY